MAASNILIYQNHYLLYEKTKNTNTHDKRLRKTVKEKVMQ